MTHRVNENSEIDLTEYQMQNSRRFVHLGFRREVNTAWCPQLGLPTGYLKSLQRRE